MCPNITKSNKICFTTRHKINAQIVFSAMNEIESDNTRDVIMNKISSNNNMIRSWTPNLENDLWKQHDQRLHGDMKNITISRRAKWEKITLAAQCRRSENDFACLRLVDSHSLCAQCTDWNHTKLKMQKPSHYNARWNSRSGADIKMIMLSNWPGTIDPEWH